jgi:hypothetical protein
MRTLMTLMLITCIAIVGASAQTASPLRPRVQLAPAIAQDAVALQGAADQRWSAMFAADRAFTQSVRDAVGAEIALRRARGENVSVLESELRQLNADTQMSFSLQYLALQSQMQHENRSYTAISNIMRTKHETARNSISNVR